MVKDIDDLTDEELSAVARRSMPRFLKAQREDAPLYAQQFGIDQPESSAEYQEIKAPSPRKGFVVVVNFGLETQDEDSEDEFERLKAAGARADQFPEQYILPSSWSDGETVTLHFAFDDGRWKITCSSTQRSVELWLWRNEELLTDGSITATSAGIHLPDEIELGTLTGISLRVL